MEIYDVPCRKRVLPPNQFIGNQVGEQNLSVAHICGQHGFHFLPAEKEAFMSVGLPLITTTLSRIGLNGSRLRHVSRK
jgi:hypothetical protein